MKALQTRSPIHLYYEYTDLTKVVVSIYLDKDPNNFDTNTTPRYNLQSESINNESIFEISDLLRSANQYEYESDFYEKRDTAIYVLCKADLYDSNDDLIEVRHNFLRVRDGYVERQDQSQILSNPIPQDLKNDWQNDILIVSKDNLDPFNNNFGFIFVSQNPESGNVFLNSNFKVDEISTFSVFIQYNSVVDTFAIELNDDNNIKLEYDLINNEVANVGSSILGFDFFEFSNSFIKISFTINVDLTKINFNFTYTNSANIAVFNPTLIKGNHINANATATDLVLQDNLKGYSPDNITNQILVDKKLSNAYNYGLPFFDIKQYFANNPEVQSAIITQNNSNLQFTDLANNQTEADIQNIVLYECKYTPVKVTFLNRFGVLQDLVFFKKRVDSSSTDSESYKANVITNGDVYKHLGQRRVYNKQAEASVKLSSGFYPESFNTVFKQLIFSEMVFIDDEPAVISTSTFRQKTQIDDKLINYDIDFDFANDDINSIR